MERILKVALPLPLDKLYSYRINTESEADELIGSRVLVNFGKRRLTGVILEVADNEESDIKLKEVIELFDEKPVFAKEMIELCRWVSKYYICSMGEALRAALPLGMTVTSKLSVRLKRPLSKQEIEYYSGKSNNRNVILNFLNNTQGFISLAYLQKKSKIINVSNLIESLVNLDIVELDDKMTNLTKARKQKAVILAEPFFSDETKLKEILDIYDEKNPKYSLVISNVYLNQLNGSPTLQTEVVKKYNVPLSSVNILIKKGILTSCEMEIDRSSLEQGNRSMLSSRNEFELPLTEEQEKCVLLINDSVDSNKTQPILIHGVTGSGKTLVYIHSIKHIIEQGKSVLLLVPEISLTPQLIDRFYNVFGDMVGAMHSRMTTGERYDTWRKASKGEKKILIGARSVIFAPIRNLGLIIVDEEHDSSFKQDSPSPRYNARDLAVVRANILKIPVVLGSATPSLESNFNASNGKYLLGKIEQRADDAKLPEIQVIDTITAKKSGQMNGSLSRALIAEIINCLQKKEGVILFQNRRGYSPHLECSDCGFIPMCKNCEVSLTYHKQADKLKCHYCGYAISSYKACPACGYPELEEYGTGTQRIEEELELILKSEGYKATIQRVDLDTTSRKQSLRKIFASFISGEIDILIGTQMVAKGLDFDRVTLVGIVNADLQLFLPDFRSGERTFQILTQVAGRAGRTASKPGKVIIQTAHPNHPSIKLAIEHNYEKYYENELRIRQETYYPPFCRFVLIEISGKDEKVVENTAFVYYRLIPEHESVQKLGPTLPFIPKLMNLHRRYIIIKNDKRIDPSGAHLRNCLNHARDIYAQKYSKASISIKLDVDSFSHV